MYAQQGYSQPPVHPVVLAAQQQPGAQPAPVQQPMQQAQGFVPGSTAFHGTCLLLSNP